jgi:hypothetical protein
MTNKHGMLDTLKHLAFEDEPAKPESDTPQADAPHMVPAVTVSAPHASYAPPTYAQPIDAGVVPDNGEVYQRLLAKTDFEGTDVAGIIRKFLEPLKVISDTVMPANVKFKTAVLQAKAQAGLSEDSILGTFDTLKAKLQQEQDAFNAKAQQYVENEVTGRQEHITQITAQITQLQQELGRLSGELVEAQGKSTHVQSQFMAAAQRRGSEIEEQKAHYTQLLKG